LWALFAFAYAVRMAALCVLPLYHANPGVERSVWHWAAEQGCIAEALYDGRGFADPWGKGTGTTGWLTLPFPGFLALLMELTGGPRPATAVLLYLVQSGASALVCVLIARLGAALGHARAGLIAAVIFAVEPHAVWNSIHTVWDTTWVALGVTWLALALVRLPAQPPVRTLVGYGLGYGALLFLNPAPLALAPIVAYWIWRRSEDRRLALRNVLLVGATAFLVCLPWMARNRLAIGSFALRPNFGVEMMLGNNDRAKGVSISHERHPSNRDEELALYRELGEKAYARDAMRRAKQWIRENPQRFLWLTLHRVQLFWMSEVPWLDPRSSGGRPASSDPQTWLRFVAYALTGALAVVALALVDMAYEHRRLIGGMLALFGLPYYVTHISERYRFPIEPLLLLLCAMLLEQAWRAWHKRAGRANPR
jgi:4-amino-4-deoxy-L-arabinose transferase-like glycosyltransferase